MAHRQQVVRSEVMDELAGILKMDEIEHEEGAFSVGGCRRWTEPGSASAPAQRCALFTHNHPQPSVKVAVK